MPAAAVRRRIRALSGVTGRKELRRWLVKQIVKSWGSTLRLLSELANLRMREVIGIPSVAVKCVDIGKNTNGVGRLLAHF